MKRSPLTPKPVLLLDVLDVQDVHGLRLGPSDVTHPLLPTLKEMRHEHAPPPLFMPQAGGALLRGLSGVKKLAQFDLESD